ncbi:MAG: hypothetical protein WCA49_24970 [Candidatus Sulfotelmatobacter sp.]
MFRRMLVLACLAICASAAGGQDLSNIQIHGFATQGFLYSSNNNYLSTNSSSGSFAWTDGAVSLSDVVSDKLRVGIQLHMSQLGEFGSGTSPQVDWATGDYKVNERVGFRAGKYKVPFGLYNDSQDVDAVHQWALLPQGVYPVDNTSFTLSALGGEFYGDIRLGKKAGTLVYRGYVGYHTLALTQGYVKNIDLVLEPIEQRFGLPQALITSEPYGSVFGGDIRWQTPLKGLLVGSSVLEQNLQGGAGSVTFHIPRFATTQQYAKFERGKFLAAFEVKRFPIDFLTTIPTAKGPVVVPTLLDQRSWYPMVGYRVTEKLQLGTYYSHFVDAGGGANTSLTSRYSKDWTVSGRYDFNSYFYAKLEEHFVHGVDRDYYADTNLGVIQPRSNILAAKIGFSF